MKKIFRNEDKKKNLILSKQKPRMEKEKSLLDQKLHLRLGRDVTV